MVGQPGPEPKPTPPQGIKKRAASLAPSLSQDALRHHLPNSVQPKDSPDIQLFWFRAAFDIEGMPFPTVSVMIAICSLCHSSAQMQ